MKNEEITRENTIPPDRTVTQAAPEMERNFPTWPATILYL